MASKLTLVDKKKNIGTKSRSCELPIWRIRTILLCHLDDAIEV
jgi:hypothetical protein